MRNFKPAKFLSLALFSSTLLGGGLAVSGLACDMAHTEQHVVLAAATEMPSAAAVDAALRDLWVGHAFNVRNVVIATVDGNTAAAEAAEAAVVENAMTIAGAIEPYYGSDAKEKLFGLLAGHYGAIKTYLLASIDKDEAKQSAAIEAANSNADEIAAFLSGANPNLPRDAVLGLLQAHAGHHISQIQQVIAKDYKGETVTWIDMTQHMYVIADALAGAIAKQFPEKFRA